MRKIFSFSIILLCLFSLSPKAQTAFNNNTWFTIDSALFTKTRLSDLSATVQNLKIKAAAENRYLLVARCLNYEMLIADKKTEDTLYFKNASFIDEMLAQPQPKELQFALELMLATRLKNFTKGYHKFNVSRYERRDIPVNYAALSDSAIGRLSQRHFEKAKTLAREITLQNIDDALWLSADPLQFLFKPDLFDIAIAEQLHSVKVTSYYQFKAAKQFANWLPLSPDALILKLDSLNQQAGEMYKDFRLYKEWLQYQRDNPANYYFIETLIRKYAYDNLQSQYKEAEKTYENYLQQQTQSAYAAVKAYSVYQLCILWNSKANKYFPSFTYSYSSGETNAKYDTAVRYHAVKALQLFNSNKSVLDSFSYLKNILNIMELKIKSTDLEMTIPENNLPGKPILAELKFKNADTLFYSIVKTVNQQSITGKRRNSFINGLLQNPVQKQGTISLQSISDYNYHNSFVNIDKLSAGRYAIVFSHRSLTDTAVKRNYIFFSVTNIAVVNNDKRIYILNRATGQPLEGAAVHSSYTEIVKKDSVATVQSHEKNWKVNKQGFIEINNDNYSTLDIQYGNDSITENVNYKEYDTPEDIYTKEEFDDLIEFYDENATAYIYTDRAVYRPGQTVFYKAIFLTKNKNTGEPMLMNKKNLKGKLFGSVYKKYLKEEEPELEVVDPFGKTMDSLKIIPNEFGSVYGSFKIPKTAATGEWSIGPDYIDVENNSGTFNVEEYKRPSYEIDIEKPAKEIKPGDSFTAAVKVKSFAGAALSNVSIRYDVTVYVNYNELDTVTHLPLSRSDRYTYADTTGFTNHEGELKIIIHDTALLKKLPIMESGWRLSYDINAEATDATGESYKKHIYVSVISRPVSIKIPLADKYNRSEITAVPVSTTDNNAGRVDKTVRVKIYRLSSNKKIYNTRKLTPADIWLFNQQELQNIFPDYNLVNEKDSLTEKLISETTINTASNEKLALDTALLKPGTYKLVAVCLENNSITGELVKNFTIFDTKTGALPEPDFDYAYLPFTYGVPGDTMKYYYGNSESPVYAVFHVAYLSGAKTKYYYVQEQTVKGVQQFSFKIPENATGQLKLTGFYIYNNQLFTRTNTIYITEQSAAAPEIIIEKYRKKLQPGSTETFSVSVKTKNENIAAELMTTMYDASLDKLTDYNKHVWSKPDGYRRRQYISLDWTRTINDNIKNTDEYYFYNDQIVNNNRVANKTRPLWWLNPLDYAYDEITSKDRSRINGDFNFQHDMNPDIRYAFNSGTPGAGYMLQGRLAGVSIANTQGLNEVVVVGYGTSSRRDLTGSVSSITIRGTSSLSEYSQPMIVLDGVIFTGDLAKVNTASITSAMVLKGADAIALFGSTAANGVLILSTKGEIVLPKEPEPQIIPRKNFNETAFFFPAIHANSEGYYTFSFTMPETVTEWNWKLMAHTKKGIFAYAEKKLNTQLPLMVQPNMPRLLYQGDKIVLQSRITNVDTTEASGKIVCKIEDAVTGDDITAQLTNTHQNNFSVPAKRNIAAAFTITVPQAQLHPLKISITVRSQSFSDGEEYTIPVLSPRVFVRAGIAFNFTATDTSIALPKLPADAAAFGIGLSVQTKPQAALLNSLPALANYPYNCAEQTFNKLLAYTTAYKLMRTDTLTQRSYNAAKQFIEKEISTKEKLPDELAAETMPWLNLDNRIAVQQKQLFNLLDTSQSAIAIEALMNRLKKLQNADGGISWFDGGNSDSYMSQYILRGLGKLAADKQLLPQTKFEYSNYTTFVNKLVNYCDANFVSNTQSNKWYKNLYYAYCRSYSLKTYPLADNAKQLVKKILQQQRATAYGTSLHTSLLITLNSLRYADGEQDSLYINAIADLHSLSQLAIDDGKNGLRWKEIADADDLNFSAEETIGLLSEVFTGYGKNAAISKGILTWLMNAKNEHSWTNTRATAAAINLLLAENNSVSAGTQSVKAGFGNNLLSVSNDLLSGNTFDYTATAILPTSLQLQNQGNTVASGNVYRYYFTAAENAGALNTEVQISKQWYRWNNNAWELLLPGSILRIADKVKVVLTVQSAKPLQYVFINDKRAAAFEPLDNSSGYRYNDGVRYYQSVRDAGYQLFADYIPSGKHSIEYEVKLVQEGIFTNGIAVLQCMYRPDITAYSNGLKIICEN